MHIKTHGKTYPIHRGIFLFFGLYSILNVVACLKGGLGNQNAWWLDLTTVQLVLMGDTIQLGFVIELLAGIALVAWSIRPDCRPVRRWITVALAGCLALIALSNAISYWKVLASGALYFALPLPLSFILFLVFAAIALAIARDKEAQFTWSSTAGMVCTALVVALLFPLLQIGFFGTTDYRRDADCIVVMGARVYEDGTLSKPLQERMDTAIELYEQGCAPVLIVSGGIEDDSIDEAQAMYSYALAAGVPADAMLIDRYGDTTEASVDNTIALMRRWGFTSVIGTSSFYHMPRIKMLFNLQGVDVLTVPTIGDVTGNGTLQALPREIPAWWYYWFKSF